MKLNKTKPSSDQLLSCEKQNPSAASLGFNISEQYFNTQRTPLVVDDDVMTESELQENPMEKFELEPLQKVDAEWQISNLVETPFDQSDVIQSMNMPIRPEEVITVRLVTENVHSYTELQSQTLSSGTQHQKISGHFKCPSCQRCRIYRNQKKPESAGTKQFCNSPLCQVQIDLVQDKGKYFQCQQCISQHSREEGKGFFCDKCVTHNHVRSSLQKKSNMHSFYEEFHFREIQQHQMGPQNVDDLMEVQTVSYGKGISTVKDYHQNVKNYAKISFWRYESNKKEQVANEQTQTYRELTKRSNESKQINMNLISVTTTNHPQDQILCYHEIRVNYPLTLNRGTSLLKMQDMVFMSDDNQTLFYFSTTSDGQDVLFNLLTLSDLSVKTTMVRGPVKNIILDIFSLKSVQLAAPVMIGGGQILCLSFLKENMFESDSRMVPSLVFVNLKWEIELQISEATCLLKNVDKSVSSKTLESIWYLRKNKIIQAQWPAGRNEPCKILQIFDLKGFKSARFEKNKNEIEGYIHCNNTRGTIIVKNQNWYTYSLDISKGETHPAHQIIAHDCMKDAVVIRDHRYPHSLKIAGHITSMIRDSHYNAKSGEDSDKKVEDQFTMIMIDLNESEEKSARFMNATMLQKLQFKLTGEFKNVDVPMRMMQFSNMGNNIFHSQLFYNDLTTGKSNVFFVKAELRTKSHRFSIHSHKQSVINPWMMPKMMHIVQYPILAYTTLVPQQNEIMLVNLSKNIKQKKFTLDFKIICFCSSRPADLVSNPHVIEIFFIAQNFQSEMHLYKLKLEPWLSMTEEVCLTRIEMEINFGKYPYDQIKKAQLLMVHYQEEVKQVLVIQMPDKILLIKDDDKGEPFNMTETESEFYEMAPMNLMSGIWERCYYVRRSVSEGDELMCIKYNDQFDKVQPKTMYKQKEKILQMQINHNAHPKKQDKNLYLKGGQILILDQSYTLRLLEYENQKKQTSEVSLFVSHQWNLADYSIKRVVRALDMIPWSTCLLSVEAIQCARVQLHNHQEPSTEIHRRSSIYSINGQTFHSMPFFNCYKYNDYNSAQCNEIQQLKGIGKTLSVIQQGDLSIFLTSQAPVENRIDFLSYVQQNYFEAEIYVLNKLVIVALISEHQYLVFCQQTLMLINISEGIVRPFENVSGDDELIMLNEQKICIFDESGVLIEKYDLEHILSARNMWLLKAMNTRKDRDFPQGPALFDFREELIQWSFYQNKPVLTLQLFTKGISDPKNLNKHFEISIIECDRNDYGRQRLVNGQAVTSEKLSCDSDISLYYVNFSEQRLKAKGTAALMTDNHFVIYIKSKIWFVNRNSIKKYAGQESVTLKDFAVQKLMVIDLDLLFDEQLTYSSGFKIQSVKFDDLLIMDNAWKDKHKQYYQTKRDAIQISFTDQGVIWDLDQNQQISTLQQLDEFAETDTFVRTGYNYFRSRLGTKSQFNMDDVDFLMTNNSDTMISAPLTEQGLSICFRNYSYLSLLQLQFIEQFCETQGVKSLQTHHINLKLLTVNINGITFFTRFYDQAKVLDLAYRLVAEQNMERDEDDESDCVFIRQMYYTMCLPFYCDKDDRQDSRARHIILQCYYACQRRWKCMIRPVKNLLKRDKKVDLLTDRYLSEQEMEKLGLRMNKHNLCQWMIKQDEPEFEKVLRLMLMSSELTFRTLVQNFRHFKSLFDLHHETLSKFLDNSFIETAMTKRVTHVPWQHDQKQICFVANTSELSVAKIIEQSEIEGKNHCSWLEKLKSKFLEQLFSKKQSQKAVEVKIVDIKWLNSSIPKFYKYLSHVKPERAGIFDNQIIKILLQKQSYSGQIFGRIFLPYLVYMVLLLIYFMWYVPGYEVPNGFIDLEHQAQTAIRCSASVLSGVLIYEEWKQMIFLKMEYWGDPWNYGNIGSLLLNLYIMVEHSTGFSNLYEPHLIRMTALGAILLAIMLFYWMRLIHTMAFYVKMLIETIKDLRQFIFFYFMIICTFSCSQVILETYNSKRVEETDEKYWSLVKEQTAHPFFDAWVNQYLLGLGDFYYLPFKHNNDMSLQWLFFVMSTFLTQIVFLNMLIAIMGDTFDRLTEKKTRNGLIQQTQLYSDFINNLKTNEEIDTGRFLYLVTPIQDEEAADGGNEEWEGGYNRIKEALGAMEARQNDITRKKYKKEESLLHSINQSLVNMNDNQRRIMQYMDSQSRSRMNNAVLHDNDIHQDQDIMTTLAEKTTLNNEQTRPPHKVVAIQVDDAIVAKPPTLLVSSSRIGSEESDSSDERRVELETVNQNHQSRKTLISPHNQGDNTDIKQLKLMISTMNHQINFRLDKLQTQANQQEKTVATVKTEVKGLFQGLNRERRLRIQKDKSQQSPVLDEIPNEYSTRGHPKQKSPSNQNLMLVEPISPARKNSGRRNSGQSQSPRRVSAININPLIIPISPMSDQNQSKI